MTRTARLTRIEMLIRSRGHVSLQTLMQELEISRATLKRDLEYLRDQLNAPIVYDRDLKGYRFDRPVNGPRHEMPGLWFSESELHSLLVAHELFNALDTDGVLSRHLSPTLADGGYQLEVPYTEPTELAMDVLRHGDQVTIASDTGGLAALVRERTQSAWERYRGVGGA